MKATADKTKRSTPSTPAGEGGRIPVTDNDTDAYEPSWGTVFTLGDNAYPDSTRQQFRNCYDATWGKFKKRTRPTAGNHDYKTSGAKPYFNYFRWRAGRPTGYYSYDRGSWHIVVLNSNCKEFGGLGRRSAQWRWLPQTSPTTQRSARWLTSTTRSMLPVANTI